MKRTTTTALSLAGLAAATFAVPALPAAAVDGSTQGVVAAQGGLVGRLRPSTHAAANYTFPNGSNVTLDCRLPGTVVGGDSRWYLVVAEGDANWVSARYVTVSGAAVQPCDPSDGTYAAKATTALNRRVGPTTGDTTAGTYAKGAGFTVQCFTDSGQKWYLTGGGRWVRASYVSTSSAVRYCSNL
jgi:uncharacterized protein YraI